MDVIIENNLWIQVNMTYPKLNVDTFGDYFPWTYIENKDKYIRQIYLSVKSTWVLSDVEKEICRVIYLLVLHHI